MKRTALDDILQAEVTDTIAIELIAKHFKEDIGFVVQNHQVRFMKPKLSNVF
jgi:hypothetical protein